jgi:arginase
MLQIKSVDWIAAELGWGAQLHETAWGPNVLAHDIPLTYNTIVQSNTPYSPPLTLDYPHRLQEVAQFCADLAKVTRLSIEAKHFPIVIGGDHSMAIGTWSGVISALKAEQNFGLIWIDAHMDSHTVDTTPSMAIHGMPLAILLGHGEKKLVELGGCSAKLSPQHVVLIAVRSFEFGEAELLKKLNVKIYYMSDVKARGFANIMKEAIETVSINTVGFGISLDLDAFDPQIAPGVGSPEKEGILDLSDIREAFRYCCQVPSFCAFEIAEYNPSRDTEKTTTKVIKLILDEFQDKVGV